MKKYISMSASSFFFWLSWSSRAFANIFCYHGYLDRRIADTPAANSLNISVKVICSDLIWQKYLSPLDNDDLYPQILTAWLEIKAGVR